MENLFFAEKEKEKEEINQKFLSDGFFVACDEQAAFKQEVKDFYQTARFEKFNIKESEIIPLTNFKGIGAADTLFGGTQASKYSNGIAEIETAMPGGSGLAISTGTEIVPLRKQALTGLLQQLGIAGTFPAMLDHENLATLLNGAVKLVKKPATVFRENGKISGVMSDAYKTMKGDNLLEAFEKKLQEEGCSPSFVEGTLSHQMVGATYKISNREVADLYAAELQISSPELFVEFGTSDTGEKAVTFNPVMKVNRGVMVPVGKPIISNHKGEATSETALAKVNQIFARYKKSVAALAKLQQKQIKYPMDCATAVARKIGLTKRSATPALERFALLKAKAEEVTAYDIYVNLCAVLEGTQAKERFNLEEKLFLCFTSKISWEALDCPTNFKNWIE